MDDVDLATLRLEVITATAIDAIKARQERAGPGSGICRSCNEPIETPRLKANPNARHCFDCASEAEEQALRLKLRGEC